MEIILRLQLMPIINSSYACTFCVWGKISAFFKYRHMADRIIFSSEQK